MGQRDIVLITIDSWRHDAVQHMPKLQATCSDYQSSKGITCSAATHGSFAGILGSQNVAEAYDEEGRKRDHVTSITEYLSDRGYQTGAFIGSNPYLTQWGNEFDDIWNDGMNKSTIEKEDWYSRTNQVARLLLLRKQSPVNEVVEKAREWFETTSGDKFLWIHLMDIHNPFLPGIKRGISNGLLKTYRTIIRQYQSNELPQSERQRLRQLYKLCVQRLDNQISSAFEFLPDDAIVVVTGDHGEEFEHGYCGHARLYEETVTVPLLAKNLDLHGAKEIRHIDILPTIVDQHFGDEANDAWSGEATNGKRRPTTIVNHAPQINATFVGIRDYPNKFIRKYHDENWTIEKEELYDISDDPDEREPIRSEDILSNWSSRLDSIFDDDQFLIGAVQNTSTGIDDQVKSRLKELGYA